MVPFQPRLRNLVARTGQKGSEGERVAERPGAASVFGTEIHDGGPGTMEVPGAGEASAIQSEAATFAGTCVGADSVIGGGDVADIGALGADGRSAREE